MLTREQASVPGAMPRIGLNLVFLGSGLTGGVEIAARELVPALARAAPGLDFTAFVGLDVDDTDLGVDIVVLPLRAANRVDWVRGEQFVLPRAAARARCELVHSLASTAPASGRFRRVTTVHDLHHEDAHLGVRGIGVTSLVPLAVRRSHRVIAVSESTRDDLVRLLGADPARIDVVPHGAGRAPLAGETPARELRARLALGDRRVLLCLSAKQPHKNLARLLAALALIAPERRPVAVLAGHPTPYEDELREDARTLGVDDDVRFLGWTSEADVEGLFALAAVLVYPSLYEGFGLPVLEAMARGVPVACSDCSSLPEVAGDAALMFNPADPVAIADAVSRLLGDRDLALGLARRGRLRAAGFSWERAALATLAAYERAR